MLLTFILSRSARVTTETLAGADSSVCLVWVAVTTMVSLALTDSAWARPGTASRPRESKIGFKRNTPCCNCIVKTP
ncbi:hypothetical protein D3C79_603510 [compost metagenome]